MNKSQSWMIDFEKLSGMVEEELENNDVGLTETIMVVVDSQKPYRMDSSVDIVRNLAYLKTKYGFNDDLLMEADLSLKWRDTFQEFLREATIRSLKNDFEDNDEFKTDMSAVVETPAFQEDEIKSLLETMVEDVDKKINMGEPEDIALFNVLDNYKENLHGNLVGEASILDYLETEMGITGEKTTEQEQIEKRDWIEMVSSGYVWHAVYEAVKKRKIL